MPDTKVMYPYLPEGRMFKYVPADHPIMLEAAQAMADCAGDPTWPVGIVLVRDGKVVARAGNGFNRGPGKPHMCPRILARCKTGEGYDLCDLHDKAGHSEPMLVKAATEAGVPTEGADAYMYGHWWACDMCWKALIDAGIRDFYIVDDADKRFTKDKVYQRTLVDYPEDIRRELGLK